MKNSESDGNTRPPDLPLEKLICRSGSNIQNWTWIQGFVSSVLCKFWWLYGGVNGCLLQEGLCHSQVYCTQSPYPCSSPLLACTSTENTQTQFWLSLCGVSGYWCTQGLFEPSKRLWRAWGLILDEISSLLPSCWGFSFALVCGVSFFGRIQHSSVNGCYIQAV